MQNTLAKNSQGKQQESRELKEILQREKQEENQLRREIEENDVVKLLREEIEQVKIENGHLKRQRDEYFNQSQVANERRIALEKKVYDSELVIMNLQLISASTGASVDSLHADFNKMQQERDNLLRKVEELRIQKENMHCGSCTTSNSTFSLQELQQATQNFNESFKIGESGFGPVYKGSLRQTMVAIKLLASQSLQNISKFQQEVNLMYRN